MQAHKLQVSKDWAVVFLKSDLAEESAVFLRSGKGEEGVAVVQLQAMMGK